MNAIFLHACSGAVRILNCSCANEVATNINDVWIVVSICLAIVIVAWNAKDTILSWKSQEIDANKEEQSEKKEKEKEECIRKQKSDILNKYLDFLKEQTKEKDHVTIEEYEKQRKDFMRQLLVLIKESKDNKQMETENSQLDNKTKTIEEEKKESINYLIDVLKKYVYSEKTQPTNIDQTKIDKYRQTLEKMIYLSQNDKLNEFDPKESN